MERESGDGELNEKAFWGIRKHRESAKYEI